MDDFVTREEFIEFQKEYLALVTKFNQVNAFHSFVQRSLETGNIPFCGDKREIFLYNLDFQKKTVANLRTPILYIAYEDKKKPKYWEKSIDVPRFAHALALGVLHNKVFHDFINIKSGEKGLRLTLRRRMKGDKPCG